MTRSKSGSSTSTLYAGASEFGERMRNRTKQQKGAEKKDKAESRRFLLYQFHHARGGEKACKGEAERELDHVRKNGGLTERNYEQKIHPICRRGDQFGGRRKSGTRLFRKKKRFASLFFVFLLVFPYY